MPKRPTPLQERNDRADLQDAIYHEQVMTWFLTDIYHPGTSGDLMSTLEVYGDNIDPDGWRVVTLSWQSGDFTWNYCDCWFGPGFHWWSSDIPF